MLELEKVNNYIVFVTEFPCIVFESCKWKLNSLLNLIFVSYHQGDQWRSSLRHVKRQQELKSKLTLNPDAQVTMLKCIVTQQRSGVNWTGQRDTPTSRKVYQSRGDGRKLTIMGICHPLRNRSQPLLHNIEEKANADPWRPELEKGFHVESRFFPIYLYILWCSS